MIVFFSTLSLVFVCIAPAALILFTCLAAAIADTYHQENTRRWLH